MSRNHQWKGESKMDISKENFEVISHKWQDQCQITKRQVKRLTNGDCADILFTKDGSLVVYWEKYNSLEYLLYNKAGDNFFVLDDKGFLHTCNRNANLFICPCNKKKFVGYIIPKNACSTIVSAALKYDHGIISHQPWDDGTFGRVVFYKTGYHALEYKDYLHFAIYRDPVERFVNYCNYTYTRASYLIRPYASPEMPKDQFIDTLILMAKIIAPFERGEAHLQTQMHYMKETPRVDCLVNLEDFSRFQVDVLKLDAPMQTNRAKAKHTITIEDLSGSQLDEIKKIYQSDYLIPQLYEDRIYERNH